MIDRRAFLRTGLAVAAAPFIVKAASLMPSTRSGSRLIPFEFNTTQEFRVTYETSADGGNTWLREEATPIGMYGGFTTVELSRKINVGDTIILRTTYSRA